MGLAVWGINVMRGSIIFADTVTPRPGTDLGLAATAVALGWLPQVERGALRRWTVTIIGACLGLVGLLSLVESIFGWDLGLDDWLSPPQIGHSTADLGMVSPWSAFVLVLTGIALLVASRAKGRIAAWAAVSALGVVVIGIGGLSLAASAWGWLGGAPGGGSDGVPVLGAIGFALAGFALCGIARQLGSPQWALTPPTTAGFAVAVSSLVAVAVASNRFTHQLVAVDRDVSQVGEVLKDVQSVQRAVLALGVSQRNFVTTGQASWLASYDREKTGFAGELAQLRRLTVDNPGQQRRLEQLGPLIAERIRRSDEVIAVRRRAGAVTAERLMLSGAGAAASDLIRGTIQAFEDEEYRLLRARQARQEFVTARTFLVLPLGVLLSLSLLSVGLFYLNAGMEERRRLEATNARLAAIVTFSGDAIIGSDINRVVTSWNRGAENLFGYTAAEMVGRPIALLLPPGREAEESELLGKLRRGEDLEHFETVRLKRGGQQVNVSMTISPIKDAAGRVVGASKVARDITARKRAELRLKLQYAVSAVLAEGASLEHAGQAVLQVVGENLGWPLGELWQVDRIARVLRCAETWHLPSTEFQEFTAASQGTTFARGIGLPGRVWQTGKAECCPDVATDAGFLRMAPLSKTGLHAWIGFPIHLRGEVLGVIGFFSSEILSPDPDLLAAFAALGAQVGQFVEKQQLAAQVRQAQKLEAVGTLAGGIAHDFNNILSVITGYTDLMSMAETAASDQKAFLEEVRRASARAKTLVRQILTFSRHGEPKREILPLGPIVEEAVRFLRASVPSTIEFKIDLDAGIPPVLADATQVHQIVMNLGTNAWHAMRERPGRLEVKLALVNLEPDFAASQLHVPAGAYVRLSVSDTGAGMDRATLERIFEPFFTTKGPNEGTGLGLSVVHGIMQSHGGAISVYSQPGEGTTFHLYFPVPARESAAELPLEEAAVPQGQGQRILFVDDEESIRRLAEKILSRLGYAVETADHPAAALMRLRANPYGFDLLITDMTMPGLSGTELAARVAEIRPSLPIILSTGNPGNIKIEELKVEAIRGVLLKPPTVRELGEAVHAALMGGPSPKL